MICATTCSSTVESRLSGVLTHRTDLGLKSETSGSDRLAVAVAAHASATNDVESPESRRVRGDLVYGTSISAVLAWPGIAGAC